MTIETRRPYAVATCRELAVSLEQRLVLPLGHVATRVGTTFAVSQPYREGEEFRHASEPH